MFDPCPPMVSNWPQSRANSESDGSLSDRGGYGSDEELGLGKMLVWCRGRHITYEILAIFLFFR